MKNLKMKFFWFILALGIMEFAGCKKEVLNTLKVSPSKVEIPVSGGSTNFLIETDAGSWHINSPTADWLKVSHQEGSGTSAVVTLTVNSKSLTPRSDSLTITAGNALPVKVVVYQPASEFLYSFTSDPVKVNFNSSVGSENVVITTDAPHWNLVCNAAWLQLTRATGQQNTTVVMVSATENPGTHERTDTISLSGDHAAPLHIIVTQKGQYYPGYNTSPVTPDASGMSSNATELAAKIRLGWNLGNSLEAAGGETAWGNPKTTKALIDLVKQSGFNAVRIPCSWNQYMADASKAQLKTDWLARVKEVIQYCIDNDMYVLLNIHYDGGWLEKNCTADMQDITNAKQKAFWQQIATYMRDFDEHLMFASANEPNVENAEQMAVLKSYHQTFIDAVRSTGGRNAYRVLVIQGPSTDIEKTNQLMTSLPVDTVPGRLMAEIHYYTPWNFCGLTEDATWGKMFYYWGNGYHSATDPDHNATWGEEDAVDANFQLMKTQFVDKGIPVVLGEFSAVRRSSLTGDALTNHLASRAYFFKYVTQKAKANGLIPFYWDNGGRDNNGCAIFNRKTNTVFDQQALDALVQGASN